MSYPPTSSAEVAHPKTPPLGVPWPRPPAGLFRFQPPGARSAMTRHAARRQRFISGLHPLWGRSAGCPGTGDQRRHRSSATPSESESGAIAPAARRRRRRCRPNEAADLRSSAGGSRPRPRPAARSVPLQIFHCSIPGDATGSRRFSGVQSLPRVEENAGARPERSQQIW